MDINLLKKRLKEIQESIAAGTMPAVPGMENLSQPAAPQPVETYNPPEVNVPTAQPKTTPVSTSPVTQTNNPAVNIPKPTAKMTSNKPKVDPKTGANGAKTFDDITARSPQFGEEGMGHDGLIDAYNAGLNGEDMSRETRDNAAAGGYLEQLEAMYNAGLQDAKPVDGTVKTPSVENTKVNMPSFNPAGNNTQKYIDNPANLGYTPSNSTGSTDASTGDGFEYTDTAEHYEAPNTTPNKQERTVKYNIGGRLIYQDEYDNLSDSQKKALDAAVKEYNSKKQSGENFMSLFDTYMKLLSAAKKVFDPKKYKTDKDFNDAFKQAEEELKKYHLDYEKSTTPYSVKDQYKNEFKSLFDRIYKKISTKPVYEEAKKNTSKFNVSLADLIKSIEDSKTQPVNQTSNTDSPSWESGNDFYKDVLGKLSAESNKDPIVKSAYQTAYDYFNNSANIGKEIPENVKSALNTFLQSVDSDTKVGILKGMGLEGLKNITTNSDGSKEKTIIKEGPYKDCEISQGFNDTTNMTKKGDPGFRGHAGYDIIGCNEIYPILGGVIVEIQPKDGHADGITITVKHTNAQGQEYYSTYCHLSSIDQSIVEFFEHNPTGEYPVTTSTNMGIVGDTGKGVTGVHLHVSVYTREEGPSKNPFGYSTGDRDVVFKNLSFKDNDHNINYKANDYYYDMVRYDIVETGDYYGRYFDPGIVMETNGEIISLF